MRFNENLFLSFLLFENRLDLFNLGIKSAKKLIASINFLLFLLEHSILIFKFSFKTFNFLKDISSFKARRIGLGEIIIG